MKKNIYKLISAIFIFSIMFSQNIIYASMADYTDEQADQKLEQEQKEWKEEQEEKINKSSNNYLKSLSIKGYEIIPEFDKQIINYEIREEVLSDNIVIEAEADDSKAYISGTGTVALNSGENNFKIDVTAENGMVRTYYIKVKKTIKKKVRLERLELTAENMSNIELSPGFSQDIFEYNCNVQDFIDKVNINAVPTDETTKVEISGNERLNYGKNEILIVLSSDDEEKIIYKINLEKEEKDEIFNEIENKDYKLLVAIIGIIVLITFGVFIRINKSKRKGKHL